MNCRFCGNKLNHEFIDLVSSPPSNSYLSAEQLNEPEIFYPLKLFVCDKCFLVQIDEYKKNNEIFNENYAYFSSYSNSWLEHAKNYTEMMIEKLGLNNKSQVIEIASNDGYLLQYFKLQGIPCLGVEPTKNTAAVAKSKGIDVIEDFFTEKLADNLPKADLILGNNVLAHVPNINDFVKGLKKTLKPTGTITMEFQHLLNLIEQSQFDTIYHEHFSYLSLFTTMQIFKTHGLNIFDVDELPTHGGSLRIYAAHSEMNKKHSEHVKKILEKEIAINLDKLDGYKNFQVKVDKIKYELLTFLLEAKKDGMKVAAYGAAAKGTTLLNYCGIKKDLISFIVDRNPHKQNKFLPGSHIPIVSEDALLKEKPDFVIIIPWNIKSEIISQLLYIKKWNAKFVTAIPQVTINN
ncbi:MAG: class I SAM-dependent methyltransferase [Deltaproteobacteria bacterium]|jgi:SAM-dependent methyltransferase|nr:class I SAM-dependent methyltransferase [Deltaproteobacteria bacterium]MCL5879555.1 class I SAM-dependent methyltransferase [Deltaproteobacteria bacterium]